MLGISVGVCLMPLAVPLLLECVFIKLDWLAAYNGRRVFAFVAFVDFSPLVFRDVTFRPVSHSGFIRNAFAFFDLAVEVGSEPLGGSFPLAFGRVRFQPFVASGVSVFTLTDCDVSGCPVLDFGCILRLQILVAAWPRVRCEFPDLRNKLVKFFACCRCVSWRLCESFNLCDEPVKFGFLLFFDELPAVTGVFRELPASLFKKRISFLCVAIQPRFVCVFDQLLVSVNAIVSLRFGSRLTFWG